MPDREDASDLTPQQRPLPGIGLDGPYVSLAALCEKVLQEPDGVMSLIRVVDRITVTISAPHGHAIAAPPTFTLWAVIGFKSGFWRGSYQMSVRTIHPSGQAGTQISVPVLFEGDERGPVLNMQVAFQADEEGLYWLEVRLENQLMTKIPLRVMHQRLEVSQGPGR